MIVRIALFLVTVGLVAACGGGSSGSSGGGGQPLPTLGVGSFLAGPTQGGTLPDSGSQARVVNLFADDTGPHELDVHAFGGNDFSSNEVFIATVAYGAATDWFDPGYVSGSSGGRTVSIAVHRKGDPKQLAGMSDSSVVPGVGMTVIVQPPDSFGVPLRGTFDHRPETGRDDVPKVIPDKGLLVTSNEGLPEDLQSGTYYASVGNFCLPGTYSDPSIEQILGHPAPQPIGNQLVVPPGSQTLTIHRGPKDAGTIADCKDTPLTNVPLHVAAGDRTYVFLYTPKGQTDIKVLLLPLAT